MRVLIDAMGGDNAPKAPVLGAIEAAKLWGADVILVGREDEIRAVAQEAGYSINPDGSIDVPPKADGIQIVHAPDVVDMHDDPANVCRKKKESSMVVGLRMLSEGQADAFVSAGSTGALLSGATLIVKRVKGIRRAAMGPELPNKAGGRTVLLDCGANAECTPEFLLQFGIIGSLYARNNLEIQNPRVGLLNIGTEDTKGTPLQKEAYAMLLDAHNKGLINFIGNIEARDTLLGEVDVVVCDGFSGNVLLKSIEGTAYFMGSLMKNKIFKRNFFSKIGYLFCKPGVDEVVKMMDYREIGGTQFLGIKKPVIKAHGSSDALAFRNAVAQANDAAECDFSADLEAALKQLAEENTDA